MMIEIAIEDGILSKDEKRFVIRLQDTEGRTIASDYMWLSTLRDALEKDKEREAEGRP